MSDDSTLIQQYFRLDEKSKRLGLKLEVSNHGIINQLIINEDFYFNSLEHLELFLLGYEAAHENNS